MEYLKRLLGELLIDIGHKLVRSSRTSYIRYSREPGRNRYDW